MRSLVSSVYAGSWVEEEVEGVEQHENEEEELENEEEEYLGEPAAVHEVEEVAVVGSEVEQGEGLGLGVGLGTSGVT